MVFLGIHHYWRGFSGEITIIDEHPEPRGAHRPTGGNGQQANSPGLCKLIRRLGYEGAV